LLSQSALGQAQTKLEYRDRGDRMEGIRNLWETGGATIDFLGAYIDGVDFCAIDSVKWVQLKFYLEDSAQLNIVVSDLTNKNYWMIPHQKRWNQNWNAFTWAADEVLQKMSIQLHELVPKATKTGSSCQAVPVLLIREGGQPQRQKYAFVFESSGQAVINVNWLRKAENGFSKLESYQINEPAKTPFVVDREFKTSGAPDKEGIYRLQLVGKVNKYDSIVRVNWECDFYYQSLIK
jgi:hypothetical protein